MAKNPLMPGKRVPTPAAPIGGLGVPPIAQRGGKVKVGGLGKKAKKMAETVPMGPMKV